MDLTSRRFTVEDVFEWLELAHARRWTDGLPVLPPREDRVREMVAASGLDPREEIGEVPPRQGIATVEKVAIQCVMAGCRPEYMPVVIAALRAMLEEPFNLNGVQCTAHIVAPLTIVSGPVVKELGFNYSYGFMAGGSRANATIGRAVRLILWNIGGGYTGEPDRASSGHPGRYTYCFAEHPEASPWEPLPTALAGLPPGVDAVTAFACEAPHYVQYGLNCPPARNLANIADVLSTLGNNNQYIWGQTLVVLSAGVAGGFAREKWSRRDVQQYLFERARMPLERLKQSPFFADTVSDRSTWPAWVDLTDDGTLVPVVGRPEDILVTVAGGVGGPVVCPGWGAFGGLAVCRRIERPVKRA